VPLRVSVVNALAVPSTSVEVSVPPVVSMASVSVRLIVLVPLMTAASLVPAMLTVITVGVLSLAIAVNVSV
jgi:hypothetical protein